jgi:hypothetical protein
MGESLAINDSSTSYEPFTIDLPIVILKMNIYIQITLYYGILNAWLYTQMFRMSMLSILEWVV